MVAIRGASLFFSLFFAALMLVFIRPAAAQDGKEELIQRARELMVEAEAVRGKKFIEDVQIGVKDREELRAYVEESFRTEVTPQEWDRYQKILTKFRLIPRDLELKSFMARLMTEQIGGFYDPRTKRLYLIDPDELFENNPAMEMQRQLLETMRGIKLEDVFTVHELTHALQDQYFELISLPSDESEQEDLSRALGAVVEGEATLAMYAFMFGLEGEEVKQMMDMKMMTLGADLGGGGDGAMAEAPLYIRESLTFPYLGGAVFVQQVVRRGGWEAVEELWHNLPTSTEQVLHPELYFDRDHPQQLELSGLEEQLTSSWESLASNVWGELNVRIVLREGTGNRRRARKAAAGWDGDLSLFFENSDSGGIAYVWVTTWDDRKQAEEFFKAYRELVVKRFEEEQLRHNAEELKVWSTEEGVVVLELRESDVLVLDGFDRAELKAMRNWIWENLERREFTTVERLSAEEVAELMETAPEQPVRAQPEREGLSFALAGHQLRLEDPGSAWEVSPAGSRRAKLLRKGSNGLANVQVFAGEKFRSLGDAAQFLRQRLASRLENTERLRESIGKLEGHETRGFTLRGALPGDEADRLHVWGLVVRLRDFYLAFTWAGPVGEAEGPGREFLEMVQRVVIDD